MAIRLQAIGWRGPSQVGERVLGMLGARWILFLAGACFSAHGQNSGTIFGNVVDQSGAVVVGASVTASGRFSGHHPAS